MKFTRNTFYNVLLLLCSCAVCLIVFELYSRYYMFLGNDYPNSSEWYREKWYENHPKDSPVLTANTTDKYHPVIGWVLKENLDSADVNGGMVGSNSKGCRGKEEFAYERNKKLRILFIGDSFTFGECANDDETFPAYVNEELDSAEIINIAVHGHGHDQILLRFQEEGKKYNPDIVVLGFLNDDVNRNGLWFRDYAKPKFEVVDGQLKLTRVPIPTVAQLQEERPLKTVGLIKAAWGKLWAENNSEEAVRVSEKILAAIENECKAMHAPLLMVYLPWENECVDNKPWHHPIYDSLATHKDVTAIDPTSDMHVYLKTQPNAAQHFKCHYSAGLNKVIGNKIAAQIKQMGIVPKTIAN